MDDKTIEALASGDPDPHTLAGKPHTIDPGEMLDWIDEQSRRWILCASAGSKRLEFRYAGEYRVTTGGWVRYQGTDGRSAVTAYNDIPD